MEVSSEVNKSPELQSGKDFPVIKTEKNIIKALNNELTEKNIIVKELKPFSYTINLPEPNKLLVFIVVNAKKYLPTLWAKEIIE